MIRTIINIKDLSSLQVNKQINYNSITSIDFDDTELGSGGFGKVYNLLSIDGITLNHFVIKIFLDKETEKHGYDTIKKLHQKLKKSELETSINAYTEYPELLGLPFLAFRGFDEIEEVEVTAFVMLNLNSLGFYDYGADGTDNQAYRDLAIQDKIFISHQLAIAIRFLHNIKFIHSDLKEAALWYNPEKKQLAIIDFDSGYHFDSQSKPSTFGAISQWMPPGLKTIFSSKKDRSVKESLSDEYWILSSALFELMFNVMPYFFLKDSEDSTKLKYLKRNRWPNIDKDSDLFLKENVQQYDLLLNTIENLKEVGLSELFDKFSTVFNAGFKNSSKRISPKEWDDFLTELNELLGNSPVITKFDSDKTKISEKGEKVIISFKTDKARVVAIDGKFLNPILEQTIPIACNNRENEICIEALNKSSKDSVSLIIRAKERTPKILDFSVSSMVRNTEDPLLLSWQTQDIKEITITNVTEKLNANGSIEIRPKSKTVYSLKAIGYFEEELEKQIIVDVIRPRIKRFDWEINLNEGIDNIDLIWDTDETIEVNIQPRIGLNATSGLEHISIKEETVFTLTAIGLFETTTQKITAHPFPAPIIKQLFIDTPELKLDSTIKTVDLKSFKGLNIALSNINEGVQFLDTLELPKFEKENILIEHFDDAESLSKNFTMQTIYRKIKNIIHKS